MYDRIISHVIFVYYIVSYYGRFPKFHRVFSGRDPGTLKSDIVSKNIHNQFARIWDSQIENSKIEIMETDRVPRVCETEGLRVGTPPPGWEGDLRRCFQSSSK